MDRDRLVDRKKLDQVHRNLEKLQNWASQSPSGPTEAHDIARWVRTLLTETIELLAEK